jgi:hypothetical protein
MTSGCKKGFSQSYPNAKMFIKLRMKQSLIIFYIFCNLALKLVIYYILNLNLKGYLKF